MTSLALVALDDAAAITKAGHTQLILAMLCGVATVVLTIVWLKFHPFLALMLGTAVMGGVAAVAPADIVTSFTNGFGTTSGSVGLLIALGAIVGQLLADSGGISSIVNKLVAHVSLKSLPWIMALIAFILGVPLFFEIGIVLLAPVVVMVARKLDAPLMLVGIPALAGLSVLHGFVPPHPGPLTAVAALNGDVSLTLLLGLLVAIPTVIVSGPFFALIADRWVPKHASEGRAFLSADGTASDGPERDHEAYAGTKRPGFAAAALCITLPVAIMLVRAICEITMAKSNGFRKFWDFLGTPSVSLLVAVLVAMVLLGYRTGMDRRGVEKSVAGSLPPVAGIMLIIAAGGGFKQLLVDAGVGKVIASWATSAHMSTLLLGWLVAVGIRLATGSATVATVTSSGIVGGLAGHMDHTHVALLVLAIGAGSLFFSHVNDPGFWLVKEYFGLTVGETFKTWSVMETLISIVGFIFVLLLNLII